MGCESSLKKSWYFLWSIYDYSVVDGHYYAGIPKQLAPLEKVVINLRSKEMIHVKIHEIISRCGYNRMVVALRMFMQKEIISNATKEESYHASNRMLEEIVKFLNVEK